MKITTTERKALNMLNVLQKRTEEYNKVNSTLRMLQGDFSACIQLLDVKVETTLIDMLDAILGDELATYFLYETSSMKDGGAIFPKAKKHPKLKYKIKTISDVEKYLIDRRSTRGFTRNLKDLINQKSK